MPRHQLIAALSLGLLAAGCAKPPPPVAEAPPPPPPHLGPPPAALCQVAPFTLKQGGVTSIAMTISNDGGYCAAPVVNAKGAPFDAPLVPERPAHGQDSVVQYDGKTSIEYRAGPGYVGSDGFTVRLITTGEPGATTVNLAITVQAAPRKPAA